MLALVYRAAKRTNAKVRLRKNFCTVHVLDPRNFPYSNDILYFYVSRKRHLHDKVTLRPEKENEKLSSIRQWRENFSNRLTFDTRLDDV